MAVNVVNTVVSTTQTVGLADQLIIGTDGYVAVSPDTGVLMAGDYSVLTVKGVVAGEAYGVSDDVSGTPAQEDSSMVRVTVAEGGLVSGMSAGISLHGDLARVINDGTISGINSGVGMFGDGAALDNHGLIATTTGPAAFFYGGGADVSNTGTISSNGGAGILVGGGSVLRLSNGGTVHAGSVGGQLSIGVHLENADGVIENHGEISSLISDGIAQSREEGNDAPLSFTLHNDGVISGSSASLSIAGTASIVNAGTLIGKVQLAEGHDLYDGQLGKMFGGIFMGDGDDTALGGAGNESINGGAGDDQVAGNGGNDVLVGEGGADTVDGGTGNDTIWAGDGDDEVDAGDGNDLVYGDGGADFLFGGAGIDTLTYEFGNAAVKVNLATGEAFGGTAQNDEINGFERLVGSAHNDTLNGSAGADTIQGGAGSDVLRGGTGADQLRGGTGSDTVEGGGGRDVLFGGEGADLFRFRSLSDSTVDPTGRDVIRDFVQGQDDIDVSLIDPSGAAGDQAFAWRGSQAFSGGSPQLRWQNVDGNTLVQLDANGDRAADMSIMLTGTWALTQGDFIL